MRKYLSIFIVILTNAHSAYSQNDELFLSDIYKDFIKNECDSFLLLTTKDRMKITPYIELELKKVLPNKVVKEINLSSQESNKNHEWDLNLLKKAQPIFSHQKGEKELEFINDSNNAYQSFRVTYGLDTISDYNISDSIENAIIMSGITIYNFSKIPPCYRQMYIFGRPLFSKKRDYAIIAFANHKWIPNASGFIAVYKMKNGKWVHIANINHWTS